MKDNQRIDKRCAFIFNRTCDENCVAFSMSYDSYCKRLDTSKRIAISLEKLSNKYLG